MEKIYHHVVIVDECNVSLVKLSEDALAFLDWLDGHYYLNGNIRYHLIDPEVLSFNSEEEQ